MRIAVVFQFHTEREAAAVTEIEGDVSDVVLPQVGDTVTHRDLEGHSFRAQILGRHFHYELNDGENVQGSITIVLSMKRLPENNIN